MTVVEIVAIGFGGFIGAVIRFFISTKLNKVEGLPVGTLAVNLAGSFLIGLLIGLELPKLWTVFLVSGVMGALTTFSTLMKELLQLWRGGKGRASILYGISTFIVGVGLAFAGFVFGQSF